MLAVGPLGPQYSLLFAWHELGRHAQQGVDTLPSKRVTCQADGACPAPSAS